jgi:type IV pilus assembly protein PilM
MFENFFGSHKTTFGLDIGYKTLKVAQIKRGSRSMKIVGYNEVPLIEGALQKNGVKDKNKVAKTIRDACALAKPHRITAQAVTSALPESLVFTKIISLPAIKPTEVDKVIPHEASDFFPLPQKDIYMDWQLIGSNAKNQVEVLVIAAPRSLVDAYVEMIRIAGRELVYLETKPAALTRALIDPDSKDIYLILDIGAKSSGVTILEAGMIKLTTTIGVGGDQIAADFAKNMLTVGESIAKLIKYYEGRKAKIPKIKMIKLSGGGANIAGISSYLTKMLKVSTEVGVPFLGAKLSGYDPKYATVIGLAMRK